MTTLTREQLHELLRYDPVTGDFYWRVQTNPRALVGMKAGANSISQGYRHINMNKKQYKAHNLVWFYFHGVFPTNVIDHINGNRLDNRIENLRDVTRQQNSWNLQKAKRNSKSGYLGVDWKPERNKWRAQIRVGGKKKLIGYFATAEEASVAYQTYKKERDSL
jgi:hypothetical protein